MYSYTRTSIYGYVHRCITLNTLIYEYYSWKFSRVGLHKIGINNHTYVILYSYTLGNLAFINHKFCNLKLFKFSYCTALYP